MSPALAREEEDLLNDAMPPPRAVVITPEELFDVDPHRCRTCGYPMPCTPLHTIDNTGRQDDEDSGR